MQLLEVTARSVVKGNLSGAPLWEQSGVPHTLEKHFSMGTAVTVCSGSFTVVVHSATNSISGFVYVVLQVAFSMNAGTFDDVSIQSVNNNGKNQRQRKSPTLELFFADIFF